MIFAPVTAVIFSAPTTRTRRARPASIMSSAQWIAADPVAQAFSTRSAGLKRRSGSACSGSELTKISGTMPPPQ